MAETSFTTKIAAALDGLKLEPPRDSQNISPLLGEAFMWDEIMRIAKSRSDKAWSQLEEQGHLPKLDEGEHIVTQTKSWSLQVKVSAAVKRFNPQALAQRMSKKFKIAEATALQMVDEAKLPTNPLRTWKIIERA